ncbi:hypothetical protein ACJOYF_03910 [Acinetobacter baumannii]|uniref:hypothetical protein n=1 Tax=Acinetobacter calcoaceticus/baumannii complex TaxID=909768 RepID=UPI001B336974|nr:MULTISPECIES: hypothetical protein [Acinetobacter calcoaceticus/baumannii complex]MBP4064355.1 hypothetical protein [Acinetobacter baumannii]MDH2608242.1 hypothetical protein [Acinetobacter baumannii]MDO7421408.1 hypothetical protein [Acinetobacter baumannii]MDO7534226.1 hypothetical protein [Acinetobacter pittii]MDV7463970.1 hypothetical protein [Acinetobacter baumannii]
MQQDNRLSKATKAYYIALKHLVNEGKRISFDAVALEAGRGRGAIKGDSHEIRALKEAILKAKEEQESKLKRNSPQHKLAESIRIKDNYRAKYEEVVQINNVLMEQLASTVFELEELKLEMQRILKNQNNIIKIKKF